MNVLFVRLRLIGDVVFTTPAVGALKRARPGATLSYLVEPAAFPVVAGLAGIDDVIVVRHSRGLVRLGHDLSIARDLRRRRFDLVVDFHGGPRGAWLTFATGAPARVGYTIAGRSWMYTHVVARSRELRARHSVENQWDLLQAALPDLGPPDPGRDRVVMAESVDARAVIDRRLAAAGVGPDAAVIVVHVSAGNPFRRWPPSSFVDLVVNLASGAENRRIILTSGPSDLRVAADVEQAARARLGPGRGAIVEFGETNLAELRSLVARAALYVGGDSGPLHVAATTDTPIVAVFGPTLAERSAPWRDQSFVTESVDVGALPCRPCDQRTCTPGDFRCLTGLRPEQVVAAAERALARARTS